MTTEELDWKSYKVKMTSTERHAVLDWVDENVTNDKMVRVRIEALREDYAYLRRAINHKYKPKAICHMSGASYYSVSFQIETFSNDFLDKKPQW